MIVLDTSVIICTHNPRPDFLQRVLEALKVQTLPKAQWELLLIDNASKEVLESAWDLSWHPSHRHIREESLGLTQARLRGIKESRGKIIVFVDDDNILRPDYLSTALRIFRENAILGVLGAARIVPEFEIPPDPETLPFLGGLALREENQAFYSNETSHFSRAIPFGAGLCVTRGNAEAYEEACRSRLFNTNLDRKGCELLSGGDVDIALHACANGYIAGVVPELGLKHLIPSFRLKPEYLIKLAEGHAASNYHLGRLWGWNLGIAENRILKWLREIKKRIRMKGFQKRLFLAERRGVAKARRIWETEQAN